MKNPKKDIAVLRLPKEYAKVVTSAAGVLYFVDRHVALRRGQLEHMNFKVVHPMNRNFVQFNGIVERI